MFVCLLVTPIEEHDVSAAANKDTPADPQQLTIWLTRLPSHPAPATGRQTWQVPESTEPKHV